VIGPYVPAEVFLEDYLGPFVAEVLRDRRWNGWACPRFTREQAQQIAEASPDHGAWSWEGDVLVCVDSSGVAEPERWEPDADGKYAVGAFAWIWDSAHHLDSGAESGTVTRAECSCGAAFVGDDEQIERYYLEHLDRR
jgi:hypothetical protein